uniref:Secreted protein n=1 Tax=Heterorhabditis bacteriophora TaxID=37862 RepID=A0A1I7WYD9_HETBA
MGQRKIAFLLLLRVQPNHVQSLESSGRHYYEKFHLASTNGSVTGKCGFYSTTDDQKKGEVRLNKSGIVSVFISILGITHCILSSQKLELKQLHMSHLYNRKEIRILTQINIFNNQ